MHPAKSVIFFTVFSGLGLGLLNVAFLAFLSGHVITERGIFILLLGLVFLSLGLLASFLHLGHPLRAWRAFSQWRSSWLSREGCAAILSYCVPVICIVEYFCGVMGQAFIMSLLLGFGLLINFTVIHCTAMIYASLKPIPAWHNFFTPMNYQLLSMMSGLVGVAFIISFWGVQPAPLGVFIIVSSSLAMIGKIGYWRFLHNKKERFTINEALGVSGIISPFDPPHSSANYLMKEMMFTWARKRQTLLQNLTLLLAFLVSFLYGLSIFFIEGMVYLLLGYFSFFCMMFGLLLERWLFFACAEHSISLYYGNQRV